MEYREGMLPEEPLYIYMSIVLGLCVSVNLAHLLWDFPAGLIIVWRTFPFGFSETMDRNIWNGGHGICSYLQWVGIGNASS